MASTNGAIGVQSTGTTYVATNTFTDSNNGETKHMQVGNIAGTDGTDAIGTDSSGVSQLTGGAGIRGWLSGIFSLLGGVLKTNVQNFPSFVGPGCNSTGTGQFVPLGETTVAINVAANSSQTVVAAVAGKSIYVTSYVLMGSAPGTGAGTAQWMNASLGSGLSGQMAITPETGISHGSGYGPVLVVPSGNGLSLTTASGASVQGHLTYTQR